jgi:hypothetical protein
MRIVVAAAVLSGRRRDGLCAVLLYCGRDGASLHLLIRSEPDYEAAQFSVTKLTVPKS